MVPLNEFVSGDNRNIEFLNSVMQRLLNIHRPVMSKVLYQGLPI